MKKKLSLYNNNKILIAPSILAANFANLGDEIRCVEKAGADIIHIDVMDGHFVPNLTIGPPVIQSIRKISSLPFDVHLMITNPQKYIKAFADAGADHITFHIESDDNPDEVLNLIENYNCSAGICLRPATMPEEILHWIHRCAMVLVMTVEPGFGGQKFMHDMIQKIKTLRNYISKYNLKTHIEVDGGIDEKTVKNAYSAGANVFVAGTSIFRSSEGYFKAIEKIRQNADNSI
ncbi:MAG TPA: ribulose-phosphate 3-epimerase [Victivallales bacterium]|nr:ribulose-phosphate 3-epimerase [Victivallales bacterium]HPO89780.1 ribulose-phosphate 3-epimerase [Victivallales bacterium]HRR29285.1 ribulose-phosphate 3-epimerase [Victivallales bacterium]HRU00136.1 ribulose-phosphate 3-epimerase [Victivallales bacterium]